MTINNTGNNDGNIAGRDIYINSSTKRKLPAYLSKVINSIADIVSKEKVNLENNLGTSFKIDEKINYNNIIKYRYFINEYFVYCDDCEKRLNISDDSEPGIKSRIFKYVKDVYEKELTKCIKDRREKIEIVKENSDNIFTNVIELLKKSIMESSNVEIYQEDLEVAVSCFVCYCFIECKIFEKPLLEGKKW